MFRCKYECVGLLHCGGRYEDSHEGYETQCPDRCGTAARGRHTRGRCAVWRMRRGEIGIGFRPRETAASAAFRQISVFIVVVAAARRLWHWADGRPCRKLRHVAVTQVAPRAEAVLHPVRHFAVVDPVTQITAHAQYVWTCLNNRITVSVIELMYCLYFRGGGAPVISPSPPLSH
jgi:hypothetical protein